jgi:hypothetical protein
VICGTLLGRIPSTLFWLFGLHRNWRALDRGEGEREPTEGPKHLTIPILLGVIGLVTYLDGPGGAADRLWKDIVGDSDLTPSAMMQSIATVIVGPTAQSVAIFALCLLGARILLPVLERLRLVVLPITATLGYLLFVAVCATLPDKWGACATARIALIYVVAGAVLRLIRYWVFSGHLPASALAKSGNTLPTEAPSGILAEPFRVLIYTFTVITAVQECGPDHLGRLISVAETYPTLGKWSLETKLTLVALGVALVLLVFGRWLRPLLLGFIKAGLPLYDRLRTVWAGMGEAADDIVAEARAEMAWAKADSSGQVYEGRDLRDLVAATPAELNQGTGPDGTSKLQIRSHGAADP